MTLSDLDGEQHHVRYAKALETINRSHGPQSGLIVTNDKFALRDAMENYIRSKGAFATTANDQTMALLVGSWSRVVRIMGLMEEKYGK